MKQKGRTITEGRYGSGGLLNAALVMLVASAFIGPGISYGRLYLFHLVLPFAGFVTLRHFGIGDIRARMISLKWPMLFIGVTIFWYAAGISWSNDPGFSISYWLVITICMAFAFLMLVMVRDRGTLKVVLLTIGAIIGLESVLGLAETFTDLRWPVSRLSWNAHLFGRENDLEILLQDQKARDYILGSPTGFHWNPNHFATLLAFAFPFFLWLRPRWIALLSGIVFLILVGAAGARLAWLSILLMLVLMIIFRPRHAVVPAIVLGIILMGASMSAYLKVSNVKVKEFAHLTRQVTGVPLFGSGGDGPDPEEGSASEGQRRHAMELCFQSLVDTKGIGLGGGGSRQYLLKKWDSPLKPISDPHNWWLEVLCEAGIPYTLLYILVWGGIWVRVVIRSRRENDPMMRRLCASMSVALIGCVPAGVSPSSMVYFLPLYGLWALGVLLAHPAALQQLDGVVQGPFMGHRLMSSPGP